MSTPSNALNINDAGLVRFDGTATFDGVTTTNHALLIGATSKGITNVGPDAATGKVLQSQGASADPAFSTATYPSTAGTSGNVLISDGTKWNSTALPIIGYPLFINTLNQASPGDSTTYYMATGTANQVSSTAASTILICPFSGTITKVIGTFRVAGTLASSESVTLNVVVNATPTLVSNSFDLSSATVNVSNTSLSVAVVAGDVIKLQFVTPAWATNPTNLSNSFSIWIET